MKRLSDILVILLKRMPIRGLISNEIQSTHLQQKMLEQIFLPYMSNYSDTELKGYVAATEEKLKSYEEFHGDFISESINLFQLIFTFSSEILIEQENEVVCRYEKLLQWRKVISQVSEVTFVMAFMAKRDVAMGIQRKIFSHKPVITHNNVQLKMILNSGFSENHFHLMGSAPYFQLSWIQVMNKLSDTVIEKHIQKLEDRRRNVNIHYDNNYQEGNFQTRIRQAFLIRLYLFSRLSKMPLKLANYDIELYQVPFCYDKWQIENKYYLDSRELLKVWKTADEGELLIKKSILQLLEAVWGSSKYIEFLNQYPELFHFLKDGIKKAISCPKWLEGEKRKLTVLELTKYFLEYQSEISLEICRNFLDSNIYQSLQEENTLKHLRYLLSNKFALEIEMSDIQGIVDSIKGAHHFLNRDYAVMLSDYEWYDNQGSYTDLWGERAFLYQCFRRITKEGCLFSNYESNLFFAYLVIKESVRSEMVQANAYVGFENFQIHQDRKSYFSDGINFDTSMARMAVRDTLQSQNILHLEARIAPGKTAKENLNKIQFYDEAIDKKKEMQDRYYYVFHFIKSQDQEEFMECRHFNKRKDIRKRAFALEKFREKYPLHASRVLGIDAASQEIGCRPEVFGVIFRSLKSHMYAYIDGDIRQKKRLPQLRASYHVGEDFLDILDGLRAIDEAVLFLGLDCGDRLGHALALGIDVDEWYVSKKNQLSIPAHDYLDNIVWLYHSLIRYEIQDIDNLKGYLEIQFSYYFNRIYGKAMNQESMNWILSKVRQEYGISSQLYSQYHVGQRMLQINIYTYYNAWKLRGDEPELYKKGYFDKKEQMTSHLHKAEVNEKWPEDFTLRYMPEIAYLYHLYHYSDIVKREGKREVTVEVDARICRAVRMVQKKMQQEISRRGIGIETNPSSNYMIGTFKRYEKHPIITFYNKGLVTDETKLKECPQIWCSINTDDQGVFSASLENEYALMARALELARDETGQYLYNKTMIYDWIDNIRINGNRQSFKNF